MSVSKMKRVVVESPFKGDLARNKRYLESCLRDCVLNRGESPYASHKMLTDCLDDDKPEERQLGIEAGFAWKQDELTAFYVDLGWSGGMKLARDYCREAGHRYHVRELPADDVFWLEEKRKEKKHG